MSNMSFYFHKWLKQNWNNLTDVVSFSDYRLIKKQYLEEINNEVNLTTLNQDNGIIVAKNNFVLLIVEKWLYRQSSFYETNVQKMFKEHIDARTALINKFLLNKSDGMFYDFDSSKKCNVKNYHVINQFYAFWCNFSSNRQLALSLINEIEDKEDDLFVVFMGLRRLSLYDEANKIGKLIGFKLDDYRPNISTNTCSLLRFYSPEESLSLIKETGFDTYDYSMDSENDFFVANCYLENALKLKQFADGLGLKCNQTHSIFPVWHKSYDENTIKKRTEYTKRILEISKILGAQNCIVHPINDFNEKQNFKFYQQFLPLAKELNINIATENMWNWDGSKASLAACSNHNNYKALLKLVNDNHFVACVDIGHAEMFGLETSASKMIESLGKYVKCIHIHDNDCHSDRHGLPFSESIDFDLILDSLARIDYQGDITFECDGFINRMPKELHKSCLRLMFETGLYLRDELLIRRKAICLEK